MIARSEGEKQKRINEAEGRAIEIQAVAQATAEGIRKIAAAIGDEGGADASTTSARPSGARPSQV